MPAATAAAVDQLLAAHARALRSGGLAALPLAQFDYRVTDLSGPQVSAELSYRITDFDDYPAVLRRRFTLGADGLPGAETAAPRSPAAPWDPGPLGVVPGAHCLVLGAADHDELTALAGVVDAGVPTVNGLWGTGWAGRLLVQLPQTEVQFAQLLAVAADAYQDIAAVTSAAAGAPVHTPADRVLVNPAAYRELSALGRRVVLTHEATHVATRADTHPWTPLWLSEGIADYTGYLGTGRTARQIAPELAKDIAAGRTPTALPLDADFAAGSQGIAQAYELSWLACDLIARQHGNPGLVQLYRAVGAAGAGAGREQQLDQVFRAQFGYGLAEFTKEWIAETVRQLS
ncbi:hypothetical protein P3T36_005778 [Kitasatospora sp. MAP12-15]|uniref:hypothetical protein n=1 Tax=unclassified Kitasatospora TaxID=2633591 RepID=UPI0024738B7F|nr:hypothetical protein [Kitasatospora sp. MAP12-44]MDH6110052.1 hypothetical protein [Kitasatospora sp. MAP12-44]